MPREKKSGGKKPSGKDDRAEKPPEKKSIPGYDPVSDDDKGKGAKKSRRSKKSGNKDEPSQAGPSVSSTVASPYSVSPYSVQTGSEPGPAVPKSSSQTPASSAARQSIQAPDQPTTATSYPLRPAQSSTHANTPQTSQSSSRPSQANISNQPTNTTRLAGGMPPSEGLPASGSPNETAFAGKDSNTNPSKESSSDSGNVKQEIIRVKGQPPRPASDIRNSVALASNHFELVHKPGLVLEHYQIIVDPEIKGPKLAQVIKIALRSRTLSNVAPSIFTDFSAIMLSEQAIPQDCRVFKLQYKSEVENKPSEDAKEYTISLDPIGTVNFLNKKAYLQQTHVGSSGLPVEQALDIMLGHYRKMSDDIAVINKRKAFSLKSDAEISALDHVLVALRGYFSSVRTSQTSLLVNINVSHGAFYEAPKKLNEIIGWLKEEQYVNTSKIPGLLRGLRVRTSYMSRIWSIWGYPRMGDGRGHMLHPPRFKVAGATSYTPEEIWFFHEEVKESSKERAQYLDGDDRERAKSGKLTPHDVPCSCAGKWLTVAEYFKTVRRQPLSPDELKMPVVNAGSNKRPTYLPSHLCMIMDGQITKLKLDPGQTKSMIEFAVRKPSENATSIMNNGFKTLGFGRTNRLYGFIQVQKEMVKMNGRVLSRPALMYQKKVTLSVSDTSWNLTPLSFRSPVGLVNWACLRIRQNPYDESIHQASCSGKLQNFLSHLRSKHITVDDNDDHDDLDVGRNGREYYKLDEWFGACRESFDVNFLIVILPEHPTSELYNHIKKYGDIKHGIHTVCVKYKKLGEARYDDNVALKINLKLGGTNHQLEDDAYGLILGDKTMVVGIDVTHPPPGAEGAPSVAAVVASCDKYLSQWPAVLRINQRRQEMVAMLEEMLITRLKHYQKMNDQRLPQKLLVYRDGVGEGQYQIVLDEELPRLRDACKKTYGKEYREGKYPQISLVVVGKRHHTRFYRTVGLDIKGGKEGNPASGTVVDNTITRNDCWDFYLQSHTAITGTARPAHYFVLLDEIFTTQASDNPVGALENATYRLCHLYGKATVSVSIPPPVYYADLACGRGKRYLSRVFDQDQSMDQEVKDTDVEIHKDLKGSMFYI